MALIEGDGPPKGAQHRMAVGRERAYAPRTAATRARAEAVRDQFLPDLARDGIKPGVRQCFYWLTTLGLIPKTIKGYDDWKEQSASMRKGGYIPMDAFIDGSRAAYVGGGGWDYPSRLLYESAREYQSDRWAEQPTVAELWCEADTHREMLRPVADDLHVTLVPTHGNPSIPLLYDRAQVINARYREKQWTHIIYVGDHDPKGLDMSEKLLLRLGEVHMEPCACSMERVAVTIEQIRAAAAAGHPLPTRPPKKDDALAPWYEERFPGVGCIELDAVPPRDLVALVRAAIQAVIVAPALWAGHAARDAAVRRRLVDFIVEHEEEIDGDDDEG